MDKSLKIYTSNVLMVVIGFLLLSFDLAGQNFSASVNRNPVGSNEQFQLSYTLSGSGTNFRPPSLSDFMVLSGPNQSTSMQFINGAMSQSVTFSYILQPRKEGTFKIEPATIESGGRVVASNSLSLTVTAGGQGSRQNQGQDDKTNISSSNIFIRVVVDKTTVYRGEALVASFLLYTNVDVINYSINKVPSLNGFWSQDIQLPQQLRLYNEVYKGVNYRVGEIKKVVLFPQQSGQLTIDPMEGECIARIQVKRNRSGNPFDIFNDPFFNDPFFGSGGIRDVRFAVKSDPVRITVKDLPPNPPPSFNGAVGRFQIEGNMDKSSVKTNDAVTFRLKVSGRGNLKLTEAPALEVSPDIETYDPKVNDQISTTEKGSSGSRTFEYLIIPRHQGSYPIGPVSFTYFDLDKKDYVTLTTPGYKLDVQRGKDGGSALSHTGKSEFRVIGRDIRFIKTRLPSEISAGHDFFGSLTFILLSIIPVIGMATLFIVRRRHLQLNADVTALKSRKATRMARKRLMLANKYLKSGNNDAFYEEVARALWGFLGDRLKIPVASLNRETAHAALQKAGVQEDRIQQLITMLDTCEFARYSRAANNDHPGNIYESAVELITKTDNEINS
jgi:hypothetical protein